MRHWILIAMSSLAALAQGQEVRFGLSLTVNGGGARQVYRGQPLLVEAGLVLEEGEAATVALHNGAPWAEAMRLQLRSGSGEPVQAEWQKLQAAGGPLRFTADATEASAVFALDETATSALAPGEYLLSAVLDTRQRSAEGAWAGTAAQQGLVLRVSDEPAELDPAARILKSRLRARKLLLEGAAQAALDELAPAIKSFPDSIDLLTDKSGVLEELERREDALKAIDAAIDLFRKQNPKAGHPPRVLLQQRARLSAY